MVAVPLAWLSLTARNRAARVLGWLADAAFVVPGTVLALAMILVYLPPLPGIGVSIYGTWAILLVPYLGRFLPLTLRPVEAALQAADPSLDEAARIHGVSPARRMLWIAAPAALPAAAAGALVVFMTALNELTLSSLGLRISVRSSDSWVRSRCAWAPTSWARAEDSATSAFSRSTWVTPDPCSRR